MMPSPKQSSGLTKENRVDEIRNDVKEELRNVNNNIIAENILFSDTVLPLKENGEYLKVKCIYDVSSSELEKCVKTILDSNKDIVFNTIQYSNTKNKLYFYTDKPISISTWEESKSFKKHPITNKQEILEEIKRVLIGEEIKVDESSICKPRTVKTPNSISLYSIYKVIKNKHNSVEGMRKKFTNQIDYILKTKKGDSNYCVVYGFDYAKRHLRIGFKRYLSSDFATTCFSKIDGDLIISETEDRFHADEYLALCGDVLSELYDEYIKYEEYERDNLYGIKPLNSSFSIRISKHGITIADKEDSWKEDFELYAYVWKEDYSYKCNSHQILSAIKGNEYQFLNNIYLSISDCPYHIQEELYKVRKEELDREEELEQNRIKKEQLIEEERLEKERKQIKRLELKRKIFPWLK